MAKWVWPAPGTTLITSGVGPRWGQPHKGIDISGSDCHGKPIVASRSGTVIVASNTCTHDYGKDGSCGCGGGYGNYVDIDHGDGYMSRYAHASKLYVSVGQSVVQGQKIGAIGSTGYSTGWHLHFEIQLNGNIEDPEKYVNPKNSIAVVETSENALKKFLDVAEDHLNEDGTWTWKTSGLERGKPWCAAFIIACAKTANILNKVIPLTYSAGDIARQGVNKHMGKFIKGPYLGNTPIPQPGDCISFYISPNTKSDQYYATHIGIVTEVKGNIIHTIEGNSTTWDNYTSKVDRHSYSKNHPTINGYFRPDWSKVGGSASELPSSGLSGSLYDMVNTKEDATVREVGYIDKDNKPSIKPSNIKLSTINYTTLLGSIFGSFSNSPTVEGAKVDFSGIKNNNARIIGEYLIDKGLNAAMTVGFLSNIFHESGYSTSAVNSSSGASGICQWLGGRKSAMIKAAGTNWKNNLTGQLNYLWTELKGSESATLGALKSEITTNSEAMAVKAADIVLRQFERPGNYSVNTPIRESTAKNIWKKIVINEASSTKGVNTGNAVADQIWNYLTNKGLSDIVTAGIIGNMMRECGGDTLNLDWNIYGSYAGDTYYGLCQWNLRYAPSIRGASISKQLDYLMGSIESEFKTFGSNYASGFNYTKFKQMTSYSEAAAAFAACYERCGYENNYQKRRANAKVAYDTYHK